MYSDVITRPLLTSKLNPIYATVRELSQYKERSIDFHIDVDEI